MELTSVSNVPTDYVELQDHLPSTFPPVSIVALFHSILLLTYISEISSMISLLFKLPYKTNSMNSFKIYYFIIELHDFTTLLVTLHWQQKCPGSFSISCHSEPSACWPQTRGSWKWRLAWDALLLTLKKAVMFSSPVKKGGSGPLWLYLPAAIPSGCLLGTTPLLLTVQGVQLSWHHPKQPGTILGYCTCGSGWPNNRLWPKSILPKWISGLEFQLLGKRNSFGWGC